MAFARNRALNPFAVLLPSTTLPVYDPVPLLVYGEAA